jgi:hypothetical protein
MSTLPLHTSDDPDAVTRVLARPVFLAVGDRRRRLLARCGYGAAVLSLTYLAMIGFSLTSAPAGRPAAHAPAGTPTPAAPAAPPARPSTGAAPPLRPQAAALAEEALEFAEGARATRVPRPPVATPAPGRVRPSTTSGAPARGDRDDKTKRPAKASPTARPATTPTSKR